MRLIPARKSTGPPETGCSSTMALGATVGGMFVAVGTIAGWQLENINMIIATNYIICLDPD
jgi:hypothetical protein